MTMTKMSAFYDELEKLSFLASAVGQAVRQKMIGDPNKFMRGGDDLDDELGAKVLKDQNVKKVRQLPEFLPNPHYNPADDSVNVHLPKRTLAELGERVGKGYTASLPEIVAHEVGHKRIAGNRFGKLLQNPVTIIAGGVSPLAGMVAGVTAPDEISDNKVMAGSAAMAAPMVGYEGLASVLGYKQLKRLGASPAQLARARNRLGRAWGTYALQPVIAAGEAKSTRMLKRHLMGTDAQEASKSTRRR